MFGICTQAVQLKKKKKSIISGEIKLPIIACKATGGGKGIIICISGTVSYTSNVVIKKIYLYSMDLEHTLFSKPENNCLSKEKTKYDST